MNQPELSDDELFERMKRKLLSGGGPEPTGLAREEQRIAAKLLGRDNARQLDRAARGETRFRYRRPVVKAEYWCHRAAWGADEIWRIDIVENGVRRSFKTDLTEDQCNYVIRAISAKGIPVAKVMTEYMRTRVEEPKPQPVSRRRAILDQLKDIRI